MKLCSETNRSERVERRWKAVVGEEWAYLGASFMPFALEWTSSQIGGRSTTFGHGLPDCLICHDGRARCAASSTTFLGLMMGEEREREAALGRVIGGGEQEGEEVNKSQFRL